MHAQFYRETEITNFVACNMSSKVHKNYTLMDRSEILETSLCGFLSKSIRLLYAGGYNSKSLEVFQIDVFG